MNRCPIYSAFALVVIAAVALDAQDWGQWRGPGRDGSVIAASLPASWPSSVKPVWRVEVGEGYSSPVVAGSRIIVHSRRDPEEIVTAIDLQSGQLLWQRKYQSAYAKNQYAVRMAKGPNSTPLVAGERVFTLGATGVLSAWRVADGALAWQKDYSPVVDTSKLFCGTAMSPLLEGGALIVQVGSDVHGGQVIAIDPATGTERWTWKGPGPGYASPIALTADGVRQIVTMTQESIVAVDAKGGSWLWSVPFSDEWHENIVTPIWTGSHLIVSGVRQGTQAYTLSNVAGRWRAVPVWKNPDVTMYMSAPVFAEGTLYGFSSKRKGQLVALNTATGAVRWATVGRAGDHASVLLAPAHVIFLTNGGDFIVAKRDPEKFVEEHRFAVGGAETWSVPALIPGGLVVRDAESVMRLVWGS